MDRRKSTREAETRREGKRRTEKRKCKEKQQAEKSRKETGRKSKKGREDRQKGRSQLMNMESEKRLGSIESGGFQKVKEVRRKRRTE